MNARITKSARYFLALGLLAVLAGAGAVSNGYSQNPPPPPPTYIHLGQTLNFWLARGAVISSIHVTPGTGNATAVVVPPNGFRVTGVTKGTAAVTVSGTLTIYRIGHPPVTTPFSVTYDFIVD